jgi:hypothetical protein
MSDAHLEWLDVNGLPLAVRKTCSRIPTTPGNLFIDQLSAKPLISLTPKSFRQIRVISALKRSDPIQGIFEIAFNEFQPHWREHVTVDFVNVTNRSELVRAFNDFSGPMIVFDGHGSHPPDKPAALYVHDEPIDVWSLKSEISNIAPIVVLSACDTHAADRNHATTANGFVMLGARTVLSSVFPLHAVPAATFLARLIYRVAEFLEPAIGMFGAGLRWSDVVSGLLRMQLLTDFLRLLERRKQLDSASYEEIHIEGNNAINGGHADPFGLILDLLTRIGTPMERLKIDLSTAVANSTVISYLQVGRPETILIDDERRVRRQLAQISALQGDHRSRE